MCKNVMFALCEGPLLLLLLYHHHHHHHGASVDNYLKLLGVSDGYESNIFSTHGESMVLKLAFFFFFFNTQLLSARRKSQLTWCCCDMSHVLQGINMDTNMYLTLLTPHRKTLAAFDMTKLNTFKPQISGENQVHCIHMRSNSILMSS